MSIFEYNAKMSRRKQANPKSFKGIYYFLLNTFKKN
jgi:hypothetical protein